MTGPQAERPAGAPPPVYIISGGVGASGEQLVRTVLAQFPDNRVPVTVVGNVREIDQIEAAVSQAQRTGGTIVHTLVEAHLRHALVEMAGRAGVPAIDLVGGLLSRLADVLGRAPLGHPGLYRKLHQVYFERIEAIEYTLAHDDGKDPQGWPRAEIVLTGVSRTGKTPLSIYLSVLGWRVANVPLVPGMPVPPGLFRLDRRRVVGLTIEPGQLLIQRKQRQSRLGAPGYSAYVDPAAVSAEVQEAYRQFQEGGFSIIDVTDKTIESSADEIIRLMARQIRSPQFPTFL
jgi:regulator of PEP synthase PpsR (kinase-PPPase family)